MSLAKVNICQYAVLDNDNGTDTVIGNESNLPMRQKNGRITIKEVAAAAGVSQQTVSRVLNDRHDVSTDTRKRVQDVIDMMGYSPSALARSLIRQRSFTLGIVTAGLGLIGPSRALSGMTFASEVARYSILLKEMPQFDINNIAPVFQALTSRHVDGIIWAVPEVGDNHHWVNKMETDPDLPLVFLSMEPREDITVVSINNYLGGRMATTHLLEQGYQHIGHIAGPMDWWEARQRMNGWKDALQDAGMEVRETHWSEGNWASANGVQAFKHLTKKYPEMDAVFVANDQMALGAMQAAYQANLRIPQDLGIVGFDNVSESNFYHPPLTTVQQDLFSLGKLAVEELVMMIEAGWQEQEPVETRSIMLSPSLIVRQSSYRKRE